MRKPSIGITPEGLPAILLCALTAEVFALLGCGILALVFLLLTLFCCNFFRDPERVVPYADCLVVSPADGKVIKIATMPDPFTGQPKQCICVFMNVFSVHVNRSPVAGTVTDIAYHPGKFINASFDKASLDNERCAYAVTDAEGRVFSMVQIAGLVARRIVCRVETGDGLGRGERFGMIKFGSRVDLYLPEGYVPRVDVGAKVLAGQSVLAAKTE
ncbi:phosphatidylserine decarboxylase family protein [Desulfovibrio sp. OttesenSCG-928-F20]|nr:phosphatidylserine decarboxylase family protein [Desulfovibrio sp. OttesenSCG-928-M16]MDL2291045.1 phosphatidylserine decarboxylase family protein [Desulfovibrio sp. OttesenSCG-928-F20]